jgi:predicted nucleic acid-binding protein
VIVVDANVIAYAVIPGAKTTLALAAIERDADWVAPALWRSELRNILAASVRTKRLALRQALAAWEQAVGLVAETTLVTATVKEIDLRNRTVDLEFEDGSIRTLPVRSDVHLEKRKPGEKVSFRVTEMVALTVEKP